MNPITEMTMQREKLALPEYERKLNASMRVLSQRLRLDVLDSFSVRLLRRYEGGLTEDQKFSVLQDYKNARVARLTREAFFNHMGKRNGEPVLIRGYEDELISLFRVTCHEAYDKEQRQTARIYGKTTGMTFTTSLTGKDKQRLNHLIVGGWTMRDYVRLVLRESFDRLTSRIRQAIMNELTPAKAITRMKAEVQKVLGKLLKQLYGFQFELVTYAANMANNDFVRALRSV